MSTIAPSSFEAPPGDIALEAAKRAQANWIRSQITIQVKRNPYGKHRIFLETTRFVPTGAT
ncbi:hypothetical protein NW762_007813 [Fusarium torreyae]|uniref:Uncharacterized protein n=1 Tax=Fusarium torreyae TaxID=1237075 RepID=A0A9W8RZL2_9HYPO|nr:hypothetical protein NW762_007813 [Fusarium torreyae]